MIFNYVLTDRKTMTPYSQDLEFNMCLVSSTGFCLGFNKDLLKYALRSRPDWVSIGDVYRGNKHNGRKHHLSLHRVPNLPQYKPVEFKIREVYEWCEGDPETYLAESEGKMYFVYELTGKHYGIAALIDSGKSTIDALTDSLDLDYLKSKQLTVKEWMRDKKLFTLYAREGIMNETTYEWLEAAGTLPGDKTFLGGEE